MTTEIIHYFASYEEADSFQCLYRGATQVATWRNDDKRYFVVEYVPLQQAA